MMSVPSARSSLDHAVTPRPAGRPVCDLASLFAAHGATVARWVRRLGGAAIDVDDAVQEVFLIAHRRLTDFTVEARVKAWLFRTTAAVVRNHRRKRGWRRLFRRAIEEVDLPSDRPTPLEALERSQTVAATYRLLDQLPDRQRAVLVLFEVEGRSGQEIAELMGVKLATVWVWLHRARQRFLKLQGAVSP
jgi:RNA polymerase sigma-70 factor (ECF subfamily)